MRNVEEYLNQLYKGVKNTSLDAMRFFMEEYNHFEEKMKFIHIAGTNGKGSCVEMISNILVKQGYKVGKFITPHLIHYNERISINEVDIHNEEMEELIKELEPLMEKYYQQSGKQTTYFELITMMALLYFYRQKVDFVVLEVGLGGLYDCTNIISNPLVSIITSIGYDHMHILGNTLPEIAYQKAGIIKPNSHTIFFAQTEDVNNVFIQTCQKMNNQLHLLTEDSIQNYHYDEQYQYFNYQEYQNIPVVLKGKKQVQNAALCIECMKILNSLGYLVCKESIKVGLSTVIHKARMEVVSQNPLIVFDGAHNEPAIQNLQSTVKMYYAFYHRVYMVSILKRKDYQKMIPLLLQDNDATFIFTSGTDKKRYASKEDLLQVANQYKKNQTIEIMEWEEAIKYIFKPKENTVNFIVGSFYTYKAVIDKLQKHDIIEE